MAIYVGDLRERVLSGLAVFDEHNGVADDLSIVDYKTALGEEFKPLPLQSYTDAGRFGVSPWRQPSCKT